MAGLASARFATADMAYRRWALELLGGFDERFRRAFREDAELALRVTEAGLGLTLGDRETAHPPGPERFLGSVGRQKGNGDDPLMTLLHGRDWRVRGGVPSGRRPWHLVTTVAAALGLAGPRRMRPLARVTWAVLTAQFASSRIGQGPKTVREIVDMTLSSIAVPIAATFHWLVGWWGAARRVGRGRLPVPPDETLPPRIAAILFDRDGTLIRDVPYNGDPDRVEPMPGAVQVVDQLRRSGVRLAVVSNQSGVARGIISEGDVVAVNRRVEELFGEFDDWQFCPHGPADSCECRKPGPGLILASAKELGEDPRHCVVVGDIGSDIEAARRAGSRHMLVPTERTLPEEVASTAMLAADLEAVYERVRPYLEVSR